MAYASVAQLKAYLNIKNSDTFTAAAATDILTLTDTAIDWVTGDQVLVSSATTLPGGLAASTIYYVIYSSPLAILLATTEANADAGTDIDITTAGTGIHTITKAVTDDSLLSDLLDRVTAKIETHTGREFTASASATRYYEPDAVDPNDGRLLWVDHDLLTVTELLNGDSDSTEITSSYYLLVDRNVGVPYYGIRLTSGDGYYWQFDVDYYVAVTGTWGYSVTPAADIVDVCIEWAAYAYRKRDAPFLEAVGFEEGGVITIPQGMPVSVALALKPYVRLVP